MRGVACRISLAAILSTLSAAILIGGCGDDKKKPVEPGDTEAPVILSVVPLEGATGVATTLTTVRAVFNESLDPASVDESTFFVRSEAGDTLQADVTYLDVQKAAMLMLQAPLEPSTAYTAKILASVRDLAGNQMATPKIWSFTTEVPADVTPPTVVSTLPTSDSVGVALDVTVIAVFSEALDPATVGLSSFTLTGDGSPVAASVTYEAAPHRCLLAPISNLAYGTTYTAHLTASISDLAGNGMAAAYEWSFTTALAPVGSIQGHLRDAIFGAAGPLPGVSVTAIRSGLSAQTDADGQFDLTNVPAGAETLSVDRGFTSCYEAVQVALVVTNNEATTRNIDAGVRTDLEGAEPNDVVAQAEDLSTGDAVVRYLRLVSPTAEGTDTDWYKVQVTGPGQIEFAATDLPVSCQFSLFSPVDAATSWTTLNPAGLSATATKAVTAEDVGTWKVRIEPAAGTAAGIHDLDPYLVQLRFAPTPTGSVTGHVEDALEGNPARLRDVLVTVDGTSLSATTDTTGSFQIDNIPTGARIFRVDRGVSSCYQAAVGFAYVLVGDTVSTQIAMALDGSKDPGEPNEDSDHAYELASGTTTDAYIRFVDAFSECTGWNSLRDEDTYSINVTGEGTLRVEVNNLPVSCCFLLLDPGGVYSSWNFGGSNGTSTVATKTFASGETGLWKIRLVPTSGIEGTYDMNPYTINASVEVVAPGTVTGTVYDALEGSSNAQLRGIVVTVDGTSLSSTTDPTGSYRIDSVPAGARTLRVDRGAPSCYEVATIPVLVPIDGSVVADIPLQIRPLMDPGEPNDDWDHPTALTPFTGAAANIRFVNAFGACEYTATARDEDTYSVNVTDTGVLSVNVSELPMTCCFALADPSGHYAGWTSGGGDGTSMAATRVIALGETGIWKFRIAPVSGAEGTYDLPFYSITIMMDVITTGTVTGYVYDALNGHDARLDGVEVTVDGTSLSATTEAGGTYQITGVPAGDRTLRVDRGASSCYLVSTADVVVPVAGSVAANIAMSHDPLKDTGEPNDAWTDAYAMASGTMITSYIRFVLAYGSCGATTSGRDEDLYSLNITSAGTLRLEVHNLRVACCFSLVNPDGFYASWGSGGTDGLSTVATRAIAVDETGEWKVRLAPLSGDFGVFDMSPYTIEMTAE